MANSLDKFRKGVAQWSGNIGSAGISDAVVKTVPLASTSGLPTDTAVMITVNRVDTNGKKTGNYEGIVGVVSGSNLIDCIRGVEGTAQAWTGGTVVEVLHTAANVNDLIDGILAEHAQDGKHTSALVTTLKATGAEINTGTEDAKIVTPKAMADAGVNTRLASKIKLATRDMTAAGGDVSYTGIGFKPTAILAMGVINSTTVMSLGYIDSAGNDNGISILSNQYQNNSQFLLFYIDGSNYQFAVVKSYDADGFTLTWTKAGSPTGTVNLTFLCFR